MSSKGEGKTKSHGGKKKHVVVAGDFLFLRIVNSCAKPPEFSHTVFASGLSKCISAMLHFVGSLAMRTQGDCVYS